MIQAIVPLKKESVRVKDKNFRPFAGTTLADLKIQTLQKVVGVRILINTDSDYIIDSFSERYKGLEFIKRDPYYSVCSGSEFFENIASTATEEIVMYAPCTSPFVKVETYEKAIEIFRTGEFESVVSVSDVKDHLWWDRKPVNYDPYNMPNSQDLPEVYKINYGFGIISAKNMVKFRNIVTRRSCFCVMDEIEGMDIDTPLDFDFAQWIMRERI